MGVAANEDESRRTHGVSIRREIQDTARETRLQTLRLRSLVAAGKAGELLAHKAARAHLSTLPYGVPAKLTQSGGVAIQRKSHSPDHGAAPPSIFLSHAHLPRSHPGSPREPIGVSGAFPTDGPFSAPERALQLYNQVSVLSASELEQMRFTAHSPLEPPPETLFGSLRSDDSWHVVSQM